MILIVDDSLTIRMDLQEAFEAAGFECTAVATLEAAREALSQQAHQLLLLDMVLPDGHGLELLAELRREAGTADLPVLLLTSEHDLDDRHRALSVLPEHCVGKPYDRDRLITKAHDLLEARRAESGKPLVLLIDDSATFRLALREALVAAGYEVLVAESGEEGLRLATRARPDLMIIDGQLPGISGGVAINRLRMAAELRSTPCLLLTASESARDELDALEAGADAYARKHEGMRLILARVSALLRTRQAPAPAPGPRRAPRILAADDSPTFLHALATQLRSEGYDLVLATSGGEALARLETEAVDGILLDLIMPGLSGADTCRKIKAHPGWREIPLAILSVADGPVAMIDGLNAGADDYIVKSDDFEVLKGRLRAQLRRKQFEEENRRMREALLLKELEAAEARAASELAAARAILLTDLERKNAELAEAKERAEAVTVAKSQFLAHMSHEIRTPLNGLLGIADLFADTPLSPHQMRYIDILRRSGDHLLTIVNDVLDLSKIEAGRLQLERGGFRFCELIARVTGVAELQAREKGLGFRCVVAPEMPEAAAGDLHRLLQVLINLVSNAIKFTERGEVTLHVGPEPDGTIRFAVQDTGIGIPESQLETIFDSFTQADSTTTRRYGGTGLGLTIVKQLVQLMGGRIWVESEPGVGSVFHVTVRLAAADAPVPDPRSREVEPPAGRQLRILVAEDVPDNRTIFQAYLSRTPHHVEFVEDGQSAFARFKEGSFDLVLMDMQMPVMDGYGATRAIRDWERAVGAEETPIVAFTASVFKEDIASCREAGCTSHLSKPIRRDVLLSAIAQFASSLPEPGRQEATIAEIDADLAELIPGFLASRKQDLGSMRQAAAAGDLDALEALGHKLTGLGGTYGFDRITEFGRALQQAARTPDREAASRWVEAYGAYLDEVRIVFKPPAT